MQGTQVRSLLWEDSTRHRATKLTHHNGARVPQLLMHTRPRARDPQDPLRNRRAARAPWPESSLPRAAARESLCAAT